MQETKLFLITYFAAMIGVVPPGLINMSVAKTCVQRGKTIGVYLAAGASFVVVFQALIAIMLAKYIFNNPYILNILLRTGLVIFLILGGYFYIMARRKRKQVEISETTGLKSLLKGMGISLLNIFPIPYFISVGTALNVAGNVDYHALEILSFVLAASLGTFTTLYLYAIFFARIEENSENFNKYSNYFMASLMFVLVVITFIRIFY